MKYLKKNTPSTQVMKSYKKELDKHIDRMVKSVEYWSTAQVRQNARGNKNLKQVNRKLIELENVWQKLFKATADRVAPRVAHAVHKRITVELANSLKKAGIGTIKFTMTKEVREAINGIIAENVNLITSIPTQYFTQVKSAVLIGIQRGRDYDYVADEIAKQGGIARRRARLIAIDQINKADTQISKIRQKTVGITRGIWLHSGAPKEPRIKHLKANGVEFDLDVGLPIGDNGENVLPGQDINCFCSWKPVLPYSIRKE